MAWHVPKTSRQLFSFIVGSIAVILVVFWVFKILNVQRLRGEIVQSEAKLGKGQALWKSFPPLTPREKTELQKAQEQLFRMLPKEKDVPSVLQEISRVARDYNLTNLSLKTGDGAHPATAQSPVPVSGAPQAVVTQAVPAVSPAVAGGSGPIDSFAIKVTFAADYQEIAHFLAALPKIPRLVTIQSVQLQRGIPLIGAELVVNAYYLKGNLR